MNDIKSLGFSPDKYQKLENYLKHCVDKEGLPGLVFGIIRPDGIPRFFSYGYQSRESGDLMRSDSIFRIASMTKPVTAVAMLILRNLGLCDFNDPVEKYIPAIANAKVYQHKTGNQTEKITPKRKMTIKHLLTHTAGYGYDFNVPKSLHADYDRSVHSSTQETTRDLGLWVAGLPLLFSPGEGWQYGHSTDLLGYLIEVISGKKLDQFLSETVFLPLQMADTGFVLKQNNRHRLCSLYHYQQRQYELLESHDTCSAYSNKQLQAGGAGLLSTPEDYAKFMQMLLNYGDVSVPAPMHLALKETDIEELSKNCLDPALMPFNIGAGIAYDTDGYGFAYQVKSLLNASVKTYRVSQGEYGWSGSYNTHFWIDPQKEIGALLMTQFTPFVSTSLEQETRKLFYDALLL